MSKKLLHNFVMTTNEANILKRVTYAISGIPRYCKLDEIQEVKVVGEDSVLEVLAQWKKIKSYHVYSIQMENNNDFFCNHQSRILSFKANFREILQNASIHNVRVLKIVSEIDLNRTQLESVGASRLVCPLPSRDVTPRQSSIKSFVIQS